MEPPALNFEKLLEDKEDPQEKLQKLIDLEKQFKHEKKFLEAGMVRNKISEIKRLESERRSNVMKTRQSHEAAEIEEAYQKEYDMFNQEWNAKLAAYREESDKTERTLVEKQELEIGEHRAALEARMSSEPKWSPTYLNMVKIQDTLANRQEYEEAHRMQIKIAQLEKEEEGKWLATRNSKINNAIEIIQKKQVVELTSLRKKLRAGFIELKKQMAIELEKLARRYQNIKKELKNSHTMENNAQLGRNKTGLGKANASLTESSRMIFSATGRRRN